MSFRNMLSEFTKIYEDRLGKKYNYANYDYNMVDPLEKTKTKIKKDIALGNYNRKYKVNSWNDFKEIGIFMNNNFNIHIKPLLVERKYVDKKEKILYVVL